MDLIFFMMDIQHLLYDQLFDLFDSKKLEIPENQIALKRHMAESAKIYYLDWNKSSKSFLLPLYNKNGDVVSHISVKWMSQTVDALPIIKDECIEQTIPSVVLIQSADNWTIAHEICHLFSIGNYLQIDEQNIIHQFGMNYYHYNMAKDHLEVTYSVKHTGINELVTDFMAWHLLKKIFGDIVPKYDGLFVFESYITSIQLSVENLMQAYFFGKTEILRQCLVNNQIQSYNDLYLILLKKTDERGDYYASY